MLVGCVRMIAMVFIIVLLLVYSRAQNAQAVSERIDSLELMRIEDAPYAVLVLCNNNKLFCSGTLLHEQWVLTSAHCLYDVHGLFTEDDGSVTVIAGADKLAYSQADVDAGKTQIRQSERIIVHEEYSFAESFINDLVLVKLAAPLNLTERVALPRFMTGEHSTFHAASTSHVDIKPFLCHTLGYGKMQRYVDQRNDYSLKKQPYEVSKHCHCMEKLRSARHPYNVLTKRNRFICSEMDLHAGLCLGDNGGQLMCDDMLRGIATTLVHYKATERCTVSFRHWECGDRHTLSVFTDICLYNQWIAKSVPGHQPTDNSCCSLAEDQ